MGVSGGFGSFVGSMFATKRRVAAVSLMAALLLSILVFFALNAASAATSRSVTTLGTANTESFDGLATTGTSNILPSGFAISETGTGANTAYSVGNGTSNVADTYSFGPTSGNDRALGSIRSNDLSMIYGAGFVNDTGATITTLDVSYVGEQWRLGAVPMSGPRADSLDFAYSMNATTLTDASATFTNVSDLHFASPVTTGAVGMLVGNVDPNRTTKTATISNLNIPDGSTFFFRWTDTNATGADDGLAVDNLSLTAFASDVTVCDSECNFSTIQAAVDASAPGATITVEEGTYPESVNVNKANLTIKGAQFATDPSGATPRSGAESVVDPPDADAPFNVTADGVEIDGFTITGSQTGGIVTGSTTSGASISNNIIESNAVGVVARSDGASEITDNLIQNNNEAGTSSGTGVLADGLQNVAIGGNRLAGHDTFAMSLDNSSGQNSGMQITDNAIPSSGATSGGGISLSNTDASSVTGNSITDTAGPGIALSNGSVNGITIQNNEISGSGESGIRIPETVDANSGISILGNTLTGNDFGIRFDNQTFSDELEIHENRIVGNATNGILGDDTDGEPRADAENNWWGCNEGPNNPGCDSTAGDIASDPHLTLEAEADPETIRNDGGESAITASLEDGSSATATDFPKTSISFDRSDTFSGAATNASTLDPNSADTAGGAAETTLTSGSPGTVEVTATLDNETVETNVAVSEPPVAIGENYTANEDETLTAADLDGTSEDPDPNDPNNDGILFNDTDSDGDTLTVADGDTSDTDESGEVDPVSGPDHGALTLRVDGSFDYDPDDDFNGTDSFTYKTDDGTSESNAATVDITIHPINDAPEARDANRQAAEDGGDVIVNLAEASVDPDAMTPTPLVSDVETANANLTFSLINGDGDPVTDLGNGATLSGSILTYDPASNFNTGDPATPVEIEYSVTDRGDPDECADGVNPGDDATNTDGCDAPKSDGGVLTVTVEPRNNEPSFTFGANQTVEEDSENPPNENNERFHVAEGFITNISPGPTGESGQTVSFTTENDNNGLFETAPVISAEGDLTYKLAEDANGIAEVEVVATDDGAPTDADGNDNESDPQTFTITVTPDNAKPVVNSLTENDGISILEDGGENEESLRIDLTTLVEPDETAAANMTYAITGGLTDEGEAATTDSNGVITGDEGTLTPVAGENGKYDFDPADDFNTGEDTVTPLEITFTATDRGDPDDCASFPTTPDQGCADPKPSNEGTVEIKIHPVNDAPTADNDSATTDEDEPVVIDVLDGDSPGSANESAQTLAVDEDGLAANQPANGEAVVITTQMVADDDALEADDPAKLGLVAENEGSVLYTPDENYNDSTTPDTFTYQACDDGKSYDLGGTNALIDNFMCDGAVVIVAVNPVNDAPTLTLEDPANQEVAENSMGSSDTKDRTHTVPSFASGNPGGGADEDGQIVSFEAVVVDESGDSVSGGSPLFSTQPAIANDGTLTYTLVENENGVANIRVVATDDGTPSASSGPETFAITVAPENSRPTSDNVPASEATTDEGTPLEVDLNPKVADVETANEDLIYAFTGLGGTVAGDLDGEGISGAEGTISRKLDENDDPVSGVFIFTPATNFNTGAGTLDISYTVTDLGDPEDCDTANPNAEAHPQGCADPLTSDPAGTISIGIAPVNTAPTAAPATASGEEDPAEAIEIDLDAEVDDIETDNADLTYSITGLTNQAGDLEADGISGDEGTITQAENASNDPIPGVFEFAPDPDYNTGDGTLDLEYKVTDRGDPDECGDTDMDNTIDNCDGGKTSTSDLTITVAPINDEPTFTKGADEIVLEDSKNPDDMTQPDNTHTIPGWATDISPGAANESGQTLTFTATTDNDGLFAELPSIGEDAGDLTYTLAADKNGEAEVTVVLTDDGPGGGDPDVAGNDNTSVEQTFTITVRQVNDAPIADDDSDTTDEDESVIIDVLGNDEPGPATAADESGQTLAVDESHLSMTENQPGNGVAVVISQAMIDEDTDEDLTPATLGDILYSPDPDYNEDPDGPDTFTYQACDDGQSGNVTDAMLAADPLCDEADVSVTVTPVNDPPGVRDASRAMDEDGVLSFHVFNDFVSGDSGSKIASDVDVDRGEDGATVSVSNASQGARGKVRCNPNGACTYTPNENYNGGDTFTITARDNEGATDGGAITVTIAPVPDDPKAGDDPSEGETLDVDRGGSLDIDVLDNDTDPDGDTLSIHSVNDEDSDGEATINPDGTLTFAPDPGFFGITTFTYRAMDFRATSATEVDDDASDGISNEAIVAITVNDVGNNVPVAEDDAYSVEEGGTLTADDSDGTAETPNPNDTNNDGILANDLDSDNDGLSASLIEGPSEDSGFTLEADGTFTYSPDDENFHGTDTFTYEADDGRGTGNLSGETTVAITVAPVNDAPTAIFATRTTDEDGDNVVMDLSTLADDIETDNEDLTFGLASPPSGATLSGSTLTYDPADDFNTGGSSPVVIEYSVTDRGDPDDCGDVDENCDGVESATNTISVTVRPVNDRPTAADFPDIEIPEDTSTDIDVLAEADDVDGDALAIFLPSDRRPSHGAASIVAGKIRYTPNPNYNGPDSFQYRVDDGTTQSALATVSITVNPVNDRPMAKNDTAVTNEDTPVAIDVLRNDTDADGGDELTISAFDAEVRDAQNNVIGTVENVDGILVFTPADNFNGAATFSYTVTDGSTGETATATATVTVNVRAMNDAPTAEDDTYAVDEDTVLTADGVGANPKGALFNDEDVDGDALTAQLVGNVSHGQLVFNADGTFVYTPNAHYNGPDTFTYRARDPGNARSGAATVAIMVNAVNDTPIAAADTKSTAKNAPITFAANTLTANDKPAPDGAADERSQTLTVTAVESGTGGSVELTEGGITFTPTPNFKGAASFEYTVCDDGTPAPACATATVTVNVAASNAAPTAAPITRSMAEDAAPISVNLLEAGNVSDNETEDGDLIFAIADGPTPNEGVATLTGSTLTFDSAGNFHGPVEMTYSVTDDGDDNDAPKTTEANLAINVTPVNDRPTAGNVNATTNEDTVSSINILAAAADVDGDDLEVEIVRQPGKASATVNANGTVRYAPRLNLNGPDSFTYRVSDGALESAEATVNVSITAVNDAPVARNDAARTLINRAVNINVLANDTDVDGDRLTATLLRRPAVGTVTRNANGTFRYTPPRDFVGRTTFTYRASDGKGGSSVATVRISVTRR